jgi:transcriptional regulator with XRE-family HTH domain
LDQTSDFIGTRIRKLRESNQLSRESLADILGLSDSYIGLIERGTRGITISNLLKIANYFNVPLDYFVTQQSDNRSLDKNPRILEVANYIKHLEDDDYHCLLQIIEHFTNHYKKI